jgi:hypothetical protein
MRRRIALRIVRLVSISQKNNRESNLFKFIALLTARNSLKSEFYSRQYQKGYPSFWEDITTRTRTEKINFSIPKYS